MGVLFALLLIGGLLMVLLFDRWGEMVRRYLKVERYFDVENCYVGDVLDLHIQVSNLGQLPVNYLLLDGELPLEVKPVGRVVPGYERVAIEHDKYTQNYEHGGRVRALLKLKRKSTWQAQVSLKFTKRGYYLMPNVKYDMADYFGFAQHEGYLKDCLEMHVYPKIRPVAALLEDSKLYNGIVEQRRWIIDDPLLTVGVRDYQGDAMKYVHWGATAKVGQLQTKKFAFTTEGSNLILINVQLTDRYWHGWDGDKLEVLVETGAALVHTFESQGHSYGLASNCPIMEGSGGVFVKPSTGRKHYHHVFKQLSKLNGYAASGVERLLLHTEQKIGRETRLILICAILSDEEAAILERLCRIGYEVVLITPRDLREEVAQRLPLATVVSLKEVPNEPVA